MNETAAVSAIPAMRPTWFSRVAQGQRVQPQDWQLTAHNVASCALLAYVIWYALFGFTNRHFHGAVFLGVVLPILFLTTTRNSATSRLNVIDGLLALLAAAIGLYYTLNDTFYQTLMEGMTALPDHEIAIGLLTITICAEACRRSIGWGLTSVLAVLLLYTAFGQYLPGELGHPGTTLTYFITTQTVTTGGVFGPAVEVAATYAVLFITFGTFFQRTGGGDLFFDLAAAVTGRARGGASKACVISSGLYGSISGSPVADVVTTGPITIPLMMRMGVSPSRAAGIESAASSGGAILPPVMGAVAFLMIEYTGFSYQAIALASLLPALLYYGGILLAVHVESVARNEGQLSDVSRPVLMTLWRHWRHVVAITAMVVLLLSGLSPTYVAAASLLVLIALSWTSRKKSARIGPAAILECGGEAVRQIAALTAAVAVSDIIIGCITLTGLPGKFSIMISAASGGYTIAVLAVSALLLIVLGLGMPTASVYIMGAALVGPVLVQQFGVPLFQAHLFMVFFASVSAITPPLAVACFAAAAIAGAPPLRTANYACKVGFAGFVLPFFFTSNPGILFEGSVVEIVRDTLLAIVLVVTCGLALFGSTGRAGIGWIWRSALTAATVMLIVAQGPVQYITAAIAAALILALWKGWLPPLVLSHKTHQG